MCLFIIETILANLIVKVSYIRKSLYLSFFSIQGTVRIERKLSSLSGGWLWKMSKGREPLAGVVQEASQLVYS